MKATDILARCRRAEGDKRRIGQQIARRREAMEVISPRLDAGGGGGAAGDRMADMVAAIDGLERELADRQRRHRAELVAACAMLDTLPGNESVILHKYYLLGQKMDTIAAKMALAPGYVRTLKRDAENILDAIPETEVRLLLPEWYCGNTPDTCAAPAPT